MGDGGARAPSIIKALFRLGPVSVSRVNASFHELILCWRQSEMKEGVCFTYRSAATTLVHVGTHAYS